MATDRELNSLPPVLEGSLSTTTPEGDQVEIRYAGDLVLEMDMPYKIRISESLPTSPPLPRWPPELSGHLEAQRVVESLQLGLLLAVDREQRPKLLATWQRAFDPLAAGSAMGWSDPRRNPGLMPVRLSDAEVVSWKGWATKISTGRVPSIEVAIRRTIQAALERHHPADALVDAVIAWENLVGARQETVLRVTTALAWLLESDVARRKSLQTRLKKVYGLRSDVVHGNKEVDPVETQPVANEALGIALRALAILFNARSDLLRDHKNGDARSSALMLGG